MRYLTKILLVVSLLAGARAHATIELNYWLWDQDQVPIYRACADEFEKRNPGIKIKLTQTNSYDYWSVLNREFVFGTGPDVITNNLARFPGFIQFSQLLDIGPLIARDKVPTNIYFPGLVEVWSKDGKQYGLPKDWATVAIVYNKAMLEKAGIDPKSFASLTWNPKDGGSFGHVIAQLTVDANGRNGLDAGFDSNRVNRYGLLIRGQPDGFGPVEWSHLAMSNGFKFYDGPWAKRFYYDDPKLAQTIQWLVDMELKRGFVIPSRYTLLTRARELLAAQKGALAFIGSGDISWCLENCRFEIGFAPLPEGPVGPKSMVFNGLADSIWVGTKHQEEAWKWVKFLASPEGQNIVAGFGVVLPAIPEATGLAKKAMTEKGIDVSFCNCESPGLNSALLFPVTDRAPEILRITDAAFEAIFLNGEDAAKILKAANEKVNALFD